MSAIPVIVAGAAVAYLITSVAVAVVIGRAIAQADRADWTGR